jgi:hypothetical protein
MDAQLCPCCGKPMRVYQCLNTVLAECVNKQCRLAYITLGIGEHEKLTEAQIASYRRRTA